MALNAAQQEAVAYTGGPLLIVAGAGTGKTTVLTEKVTHLITNKLAEPEEILGLTFTDKAAAELCARVETALNLGYSDLTVSTFHLFCQRILQEFALEIGLPRQFKVLTETESWLLLRQNIYEIGLNYYRPLGNPAKYIPDLLRHFSKCKDELISPPQYLEYAENAAHSGGDDNIDERSRLTELANAYHHYNRLVLQAGGLDFGDLIFYTVKLLRERPRVRDIIQKRYKFILVDEFQDVNWAQYELVRLLSQKAQLTVVGDDDQSIYAFRGASVSNILRFRDDYPTAKSVVLNENYRSHQAILDAAYLSIQNNNPDRLEAKLEINKKLVAAREPIHSDLPAVQCRQYPTLDDEVRAVVQEIARLKNADETIQWSDFAILGRANNHLEPFTQALEKAGIPFEFLSAAGLYRQPIVLDAFNFLKVVHQTRESTALFRLLHMSCVGLDAADIHAIAAAGKRKNLTYFEIIKEPELWGLSEAGQTAARTLAALITAAIAESKTAKPTTLLYRFLEGCGYLAYLAQAENSGEPAIIRQIFQLKQFFEIIAEFEASVQNPHVANFVEYLDSLIEAGEEGPLHQSEEAATGVQVMSVHGSKGLEFKYVFVVNMVEERFPTRRRGEGLEIPPELIHEQTAAGDAHYQEERRLFYVAATRARDALFLTSAANYGGVRGKKISRFVVEAGLASAPSSKKTALTTALKDAHAPLPPTSDSTPINYTAPREFSFSQIQAYLKCPYYYKLKHIIKLPTRGAAHFSFGQTLHLTLQTFYERVKELNSAQQSSLFGTPEISTSIGIKVPSVEELLQTYEEKFISDWYESAKQRDLYHAQGRNILRTFYTAQEGNWTIPLALEDSFKIQIGGAVLKGKIDRLDQNADGSLHIIDYKTGQPKEKLQTDDKDQLLIYQIATETLPKYRNLGPTKQLTFYYLNTAQPISFEAKAEDLDRLRDKITNTVDQIRSGDFHATPSQFVCDHCEFKSICEFRAR